MLSFRRSLGYASMMDVGKICPVDTRISGSYDEFCTY